MDKRNNTSIVMVAYSEYLSDARVRRAAEALVSRGHKVVSYSLKEVSQPATAEVNGVQLRRVPFVRYRGGSSLLYVLAYLLFIMYMAASLAVKGLRESPSVVYLHTMPDFVVLASVIPRLLGSRVVLDFHDMMPELYMDKFRISENHVITRLLKLQERWCASLADAVVCVHEPHRDILVGRGIRRDKISIVVNVPDPLHFGTTMREWGPVSHLRLAYHGTITRRLGLDIAVAAFARVVSRLPDARFDIYGVGDFLGELRQIVVKNKLESSVHVGGKAFKLEQLRSMLTDAAIGIIANRKTRASELMLPVKLMEYVYLGIPVVAPRLKTIMHYFPEESITYYEAEDVEGLAGAIESLWESEDLRRQRAERAQQILSNYNWAEIKNNLFVAAGVANT